jgi:hypothetical protein
MIQWVQPDIMGSPVQFDRDFAEPIRKGQLPDASRHEKGVMTGAGDRLRLRPCACAYQRGAEAVPAPPWTWGRPSRGAPSQAELG